MKGEDRSTVCSRWHFQLLVECLLGSSILFTPSCMSHFGYRSTLPENISFSMSVLAFGRGCPVAAVTRGRARGVDKAGHLQLLEVTTWRKVTRSGAGGILAEPAPVASQLNVWRGRGRREVLELHAGGLVGPPENHEQQQKGQPQCNK